MAEQQGPTDAPQLSAEGPEELPADLEAPGPVPAFSGYLRALSGLILVRHANG